ncbi:MAG: hypothetical protein DMF55_04125 [Acidobacteria bacterium]|nr:MAG: hypothetical protein DMF55_04125 [Acidobacteriota bacterium]
MHLAARPAERPGDFRGPGVADPDQNVDLPFTDRLGGDAHGPKEPERAQVSLGLGEPGRIERVPLGEEQLATDDFRPRDPVDGVGGPGQEGRLRVLEDVLCLDADVSDARGRLRGRRGDRDRRGKQGPEEKRADASPAPVQRPHTKIRGMRGVRGSSS